MKVIAGILSTLVLSSGLALAQSGGSAPSAPPATSPQGKSGTSGGTTGPSISSPNGVTTPAPSDGATTGRGPGVNPSNPQDQTSRGNPQDLTRPGGSNPQNLNQIAPGVPNIAAPERR